MKRKILVALVFLIIAAAATSVAFATPATINGIEFNIPDGYTPLNESNNSNGISVYSSGENILMILIDDNQSAIDDFRNNHSYVQKNISGHDGYYHVDSNNATSFAYVENSKTVIIITSDENILESLIK